MPPTSQDLTLGLFYRVDLGEGEVSWTLLVIGSQSAMRNMLDFIKSPGTKSVVFAGHSLTKLEGLVLCLSMILLPPEDGLSEAESLSTSNLSLTLTIHPARMPDGPPKGGYIYTINL